MRRNVSGFCLNRKYQALQILLSDDQTAFDAVKGDIGENIEDFAKKYEVLHGILSLG